MGEDQTPIHYAAKNNAVASLKILLKLGANLNDRDYKQRTPIFLAAENGNYATQNINIYIILEILVAIKDNQVHIGHYHLYTDILLEKKSMQKL